VISSYRNMFYIHFFFKIIIKFDIIYNFYSLISLSNLSVATYFVLEVETIWRLCLFFQKKLPLAIFLKKNDIFWQFFLKKCQVFWQFFDSQMAIFRRVSLNFIYWKRSTCDLKKGIWLRNYLKLVYQLHLIT